VQPNTFTINSTSPHYGNFLPTKPLIIGGLIGVGSFSEVFEVLGGPIVWAVKVLDARSTRCLPAMRSFDMETNTLGMIDHRNVVPVIARGTVEGRPAYMMPRALGTLNELTGPQMVASRFMSEVESANEAFADLGFSHGDLHSGNILVFEVNGDFTLRLADPRPQKLDRSFDRVCLAKIQTQITNKQQTTSN
jgi:serine/threonine protein kinase